MYFFVTEKTIASNGPGHVKNSILKGDKPEDTTSCLELQKKPEIRSDIDYTNPDGLMRMKENVEKSVYANSGSSP